MNLVMQMKHPSEHYRACMQENLDLANLRLNKDNDEHTRPSDHQQDEGDLPKRKQEFSMHITYIYVCHYHHHKIIIC